MTARRFQLGFRGWAALSVIVTLVGFYNFGVVAAARLTIASPVPLKYELVYQMTGAYAFLAVLPVIFRLAVHFPLGRRSWPRHVPVHLAGLAVLGACYTTLMIASRSALFPLLGWGRYPLGNVRYRFLAEYPIQAFAYALAVAVVTSLDHAQRSRERELEASRLEGQLAEARIVALQMQLQPHFLFNTLNLISSCLRTDPGRADTMLAHLADFLRLTLRAPRAQEVTLDRELTLLSAYLEIMKARFEERLHVDLKVAPNVRSAMVPQLVLQPLVENAVKHSMQEHARAGRVRIAAERAGAALRLVVQDNGPGIAGGLDAVLGRGIGLSSTEERLLHLYGGRHRLEASAAPDGGLILSLEIPYHSAPDEAAHA